MTALQKNQEAAERVRCTYLHPTNGHKREMHPKPLVVFWQHLAASSDSGLRAIGRVMTANTDSWSFAKADSCGVVIPVEGLVMFGGSIHRTHLKEIGTSIASFTMLHGLSS
jgi:hypothetical protein